MISVKNQNRLAIKLGVLLVVAIGIASCSKKSPEIPATAEDNGVAFYMTTGDRASLLAKTALTVPDQNAAVIAVDTTQRFQSIDGFGFSLTGGSAALLHALDSGKRATWLKELFLTEGQGIGISYLRISIGASDLDDHVFSYADKKPANGKAFQFSLDEDRKHLIPILKEIIALNPNIKIMGSPWSAPTWMKDNDKAKAGKLKPEFYEAYAKYFVQYIQEMKQEGIAIDAVTLQNEPENPKNTPSMIMTAEDQALFVKKNLGPAFKTAGIATKIVVFDHNCDHPEYPIAVLNDAEAKPFVDGSAFHLYLGEIEVLSKVHEAHPDKNVYFTEQWTSGEGSFAGDLQWHTKHLVIGATRNWSRNVLEWNLAADPQFNPHTPDGGCTSCQGALTIGAEVTRNVSYYIIGHASKFVPEGSVRIASTEVEGVPNVTFITPQGKKVMVAVNDTDAEKHVGVKAGTKTFNATLPKGAVATFVW
ncbi:glycoside hydrolase family 30 protein [Chryseolinea lacunae]|uniref:Glucosylceramidase n=1 Tax=Chryseolinea lacunae TaxID=2801331 RepID=A0ABS1KMU3_9BACT|nr:glycoside hydrolase family 30 beta sandwich domain-containing protein [Chryseolinea lacunae]MBL0740793.1 glucosylceramidase [Chryseolinea lacunae]